MSAQQGLGRLFNLATTATTAATRLNMKGAAGVTIVAIGATSGNVTITEANAASGGTSQNLATGITEYFTATAGTAAWTRVTQAAAATVTCATGGLLAVYVSAAQLADGFYYIAASHSSASFVYIFHDLAVKRYAPNLAALNA